MPDITDHRAAYRAALTALTPEHTAAAAAEGWQIVLHAHTWQLQAIDIQGLQDDIRAHRTVKDGTQPHHEAAKRFLQAFSAMEYTMVMFDALAYAVAGDPDADATPNL